MKIDVNHVAKLANLVISEKDLKKFQKQLEETINYVESLNEINTKGIEPTSQVTGLENVTREDEIDSTRTLSQEETLSNTSSKINGLFKVRGVIQNE